MDGLASGVSRGVRRLRCGCAGRLVKVYSGGSIPTTVPAFFLTHPVGLGGTEDEGDVPTQTEDTAETIPVYVLGPDAPVAGDLLAAHATGGRWVAWFGAGTQPVEAKCCQCFYRDGIYGNWPGLPGGIADANITLTLDATFGGGTTFTLAPKINECAWVGSCFYHPTGAGAGYYRWSFAAGLGYFQLDLSFYGSSSDCSSGIPGSPYALRIGATSQPTVGPLTWTSTDVGSGTGPGLAGVTSISLAQSTGPVRCYWLPIVLACFGEPAAGALIELLQDGTPFASETAGASGAPPPIEYTSKELQTGISYRVSLAGYATSTGTVSCVGYPLPDTITLATAGCCQKFYVGGCLNQPVSGAVVSVRDGSGGSELAGGTVNSSGFVSLSWSGSCTRWVRVTEPSGRFATYGQTVAMSSENETDIQLSAASGYHCLTACNVPLADTLHATWTVAGAQTFTHDGTNWVSSFNASGHAYVVTLTAAGAITITRDGVSCGTVTYSRSACPPSYSATITPPVGSCLTELGTATVQELYTMLQRRLSEGSDSEREHARRRLSLPDAAGYRMPDGYPSLTEMAGNAAKAAAGFVRSGFATVDATERMRRLGICHECDRYDAAAGRCRACGCVASLKARIESSHCPIGKW